MNRVSSTDVLCPSACLKEGALLLGIVTQSGRVAFAPNRLTVNESFINAAQEGRPAEKRFRFASACAQSGCTRWAGNRCGVIDAVVDEPPTNSADAALPACSIRPQCRWYLQNGTDACHVCPWVITDCRGQSCHGALR